VKFKGEFAWHKHANEDELFYILKGHLTLEFRDKTMELKENEFLIVPKGIVHRPVAETEVAIMLFEPNTTINTGNIKNNLTKEALDLI